MLLLALKSTLQSINILTFPWTNHSIPFFALLIYLPLEIMAGSARWNLNIFSDANPNMYYLSSEVR